jgi:DNA-binding response OmpR family regulator
MRILFVENHRVFRDLVVSQFLAHHEVHTAETIEAARHLLTAGRFDCVLVDYDLDDGKGDELVRSCRSRDFAGVVIGVSSHDEGNSCLLAAGADAVCPKASFREIEAVIRRVSSK